MIAFTTSANNFNGKEAGMDDFLSKPVIPEELDGIIAKYNTRKFAISA